MQEAPSTPLTQETAPLLRTAWLGRTLYGYERTDSTNTRATEQAAAGAPTGTVITAEFQEQGRGRMGRIWEATAGQNLTFSVILRPSLAPERLGLLSLAAGLAVAEVVAAYAAPLSPTIKWPNDILLEGRKCCGMLLETAFPAAAGSAPPTVVLGIGLNVNQDAFPEGYLVPPTSLLLATGRHIARPPLLADLLLALEQQHDVLLRDPDAVHRRYTKRLDGIGTFLTLRMPRSGDTIKGTMTGVTDEGALCLRTETGLRTFHAGEVTTQP